MCVCVFFCAGFFLRGFICLCGGVDYCVCFGVIVCVCVGGGGGINLPSDWKVNR